MEKTIEVTKRRETGRALRILGKAASLAVIAAIAALGWQGPGAAAGAAGGTLAAGLYSAAYLSSHLGAGGRDRMFDARLARSAFVRLAALAAGGATAYFLGKAAIISYLGAFAICFPVLVATEFGRARAALMSAARRPAPVAEGS